MTDLLERPSRRKERHPSDEEPGERPPIDPRIARRWIDARREEGRRRLHLLLAGGGVVVAVGLALGSLYTPLFRVRHVHVSVAGPMSAAVVQRLSGVNGHTLTVNVDAGSVAARLNADPWLGAARVERHWPGTVDIAVAVRSPLAVVAIPAAGTAAGTAEGASAGTAAGTGAPSGWAEVDATGRVLADLPGPTPGLPVLQGIRSVPPVGGWLPATPGPAADPGAAPGRLVDMAAPSDGADVPSGPAAALAVVRSLPSILRADVFSVQAGGGAGLALVIQPPRVAVGTVTVLLGDGSELQSKVTALLTLLDQSDLSGVAGIDLSVPTRPAMASSVAGLSPAPRP